MVDSVLKGSGQLFFGRIPVVLTRHNDYGKGVDGSDHRASLMIGGSSLVILKGSALTICISRYVQRRLLERGMNREALQAVYNGVDIAPLPSVEKGLL